MFLIGALMKKLANTYHQKENEMLDYANVTPLLDPLVSWASYAPYESSSTVRNKFSKQTTSAGTKSDPFELFVSKAGVNAPTAIQGTTLDKFFNPVSYPQKTAVNQNHVVKVSCPDAETDRIAKQRIRLMAFKYASNNASSEIVARLEILNQRLLNQSPRISKVQVEMLELATEKLARFSMAREERSRRLGIPI